MHSTLVTRKMQIKIMAHYYIHLRIGQMKVIAHTKCWQGCGGTETGTETPYTADDTTHFGKQLTAS